MGHSCHLSFPCSSNQRMQLEGALQQPSSHPRKALSSMAFLLNLETYPLTKIPFLYNSACLPLLHATQNPTNVLSSRKILLMVHFPLSKGEWYAQKNLASCRYFPNSCFRRYPRRSEICSIEWQAYSGRMPSGDHSSSTIPSSLADLFPLVVAKWISQKVEFSQGCIFCK